MKKRYLYAILFGIPGFILALIASFAVSGFLMGVLWIFVFGDDPWPASVEIILPTVFLLTFIPLWLGSIIVGYKLGKRDEEESAVNRQLIWLSLGVIAIAMLFIVFYQFRVGNLGPPPDSVVCSDYCVAQGFFASSMPPRDSGKNECSCLDETGAAALTVPFDELVEGK